MASTSGPCYRHAAQRTPWRCIRCRKYACGECLRKTSHGFSCIECAEPAAREQPPASLPEETTSSPDYPPTSNTEKATSANSRSPLHGTGANRAWRRIIWLLLLIPAGIGLVALISPSVAVDVRGVIVRPLQSLGAREADRGGAASGRNELEPPITVNHANDSAAAVGRIELDPALVTHLADQDGSGIAKVGVMLEGEGIGGADEALYRDATIAALSSFTSAELLSPGGPDRLKLAVTSSISDLTNHPVTVHFSEFAVQNS